jgi:hypothetical protein
MNENNKLEAWTPWVKKKKKIVERFKLPIFLQVEQH